MKATELGGGFVIPDSIVVQQASSLATATFIANLVGPADRVADLTAGLGINTICFARRCREVTAVEKDSCRAEALRVNISNLGINNVEVESEDCIRWLASSAKAIDVAFADPSRRTAGGARKFLLQDYQPDINEIIPLLPSSCRRFLVKVSPLLDLTACMAYVPTIAGFYVVEYKREVKELILDIRPGEDIPENPFITCVRLSDNQPPELWDFTVADLNSRNLPEYVKNKDAIEEGIYLYEPSPSLMKAATVNALASHFPTLRKLSANTHLFVRREIYDSFPGRKFRIEGFVASSDLKKLKGSSFSVISRNHPAKAQEIESRFRLRASDTDFLIACTVGKEKAILKCNKI